MVRGIEEEKFIGSMSRCARCNALVPRNRSCSQCERQIAMEKKKRLGGQRFGQPEDEEEEDVLAKPGPSGILPQFIEDRLLYAELSLMFAWMIVDFAIFSYLAGLGNGLGLTLIIFFIPLVFIFCSEYLAEIVPITLTPGATTPPLGFHIFAWVSLIVLHAWLLFPAPA